MEAFYYKKLEDLSRKRSEDNCNYFSLLTTLIDTITTLKNQTWTLKEIWTVLNMCTFFKEKLAGDLTAQEMNEALMISFEDKLEKRWYETEHNISAVRNIHISNENKAEQIHTILYYYDRWYDVCNQLMDTYDFIADYMVGLAREIGHAKKLFSFRQIERFGLEDSSHLHTLKTTTQLLSLANKWHKSLKGVMGPAYSLLKELKTKPKEESTHQLTNHFSENSANYVCALCLCFCILKAPTDYLAAGDAAITEKKQEFAADKDHQAQIRELKKIYYT